MVLNYQKQLHTSVFDLSNFYLVKIYKLVSVKFSVHCITHTRDAFLVNLM